MIYFDNAATGGFKPAASVAAAITAIEKMRTNPGRSGHALSQRAAFAVYGVRKKVAEFFDAESPERVVFTQNCTAALNTALFGILKEGDEVVTTVTEHNSVLRPLYELERRGVITLKIISPKGNFITAEDVAANLTEKTALVAVSGASNVTGEPNDVSAIGKLLKDKKITFLVDGAQSGGHIRTDMQRDYIDVLCLAGHKGLLSVQGVGVLVFGENTDIRPLVYGGTGTETFSRDMPADYPERLEGGTVNLPAILSLGGGIDYLAENFADSEKRLRFLTRYLVEELSSLNRIKVYSRENACGIVSFSSENTPSQELEYLLSSSYGIAVRGGFHCAPLMHRFLKTDEYGLLRVSFSPENTTSEIDVLVRALRKS